MQEHIDYEIVKLYANVSNEKDCAENRMFQMVTDIQEAHGQEQSEQETRNVIQYMEAGLTENTLIGSELDNCTQGDEKRNRVLMWRVGLLASMLAAQIEGIRTANVPRTMDLVCSIIRSAGDGSCDTEPDADLFQKMVKLAAEQKDAYKLERKAKCICESLKCDMNTRIGKGLTDSYSHPIDSGIVRMLDMPAVNAVFKKLVDFNADTAMGQMLASSIPVTENNYPELYQIVEDCTRILRIRKPYVVVTNHVAGLNAMTFGSDEQPYIAITSLMLKVMKPSQLRFVVGHECGHIAMGHVVYHTAASVLGMFGQFIPVIGPTLYGSISFPLNAWSRRSEITADRAGFICCGDLETSQKTLLQLESMFTSADDINMDQYLEQSHDFLKKSVLRRVGEYTRNHPLTPKRIEALRLFAGSEAYYEAAGQEAPSGVMSRYELGRRTEEIISVLG